jgi:hypothetical protein
VNVARPAWRGFWSGLLGKYDDENSERAQAESSGRCTSPPGGTRTGSRGTTMCSGPCRYRAVTLLPRLVRDGTEWSATGSSSR